MTNKKKQKEITTLEKSINKSLPLKESGSWPASHHLFEEQSTYAIIAALASNNPLLLKGEPGLGKSQLARAAAQLMGRRLITTVVQAQTEFQELLWGIDHTQRLADAQIAGATNDTSRLNDYSNYIAPGALWWAMDWHDAEQQATKCSSNFSPAQYDDAPDAIEQGVVLLIDEFDKADISLANSLLEALGNGSFSVPALNGKTINSQGINSQGINPLVILTSNNTRELPAALERRCVVHEMTLPDDLLSHFVSLGQTHFPNMQQQVQQAAAEQIIEDRNKCRTAPKTGQAEYLDLLSALNGISQNAKEQLEWLNKLGNYFHKSR